MEELFLFISARAPRARCPTLEGGPGSRIDNPELPHSSLLWPLRTTPPTLSPSHAQRAEINDGTCRNIQFSMQNMGIQFHILCTSLSVSEWLCTASLLSCLKTSKSLYADGPFQGKHCQCMPVRSNAVRKKGNILSRRMTDKKGIHVQVQEELSSLSRSFGLPSKWQAHPALLLIRRLDCRRRSWLVALFRVLGAFGLGLDGDPAGMCEVSSWL